MCAQLKDVTDSEWKHHQQKVDDIDERISEVEQVAYSSRNWLRVLGAIFICSQGIITYVVSAPNANEKAIIELTQIVKANSRSDSDHHNDRDKHTSMEVLRDKFVPSPEQKERDLAQDARVSQLRADMKEGFTRIENQALRQNQEMGEQRKILIEVLQAVKE